MNAPKAGSACATSQAADVTRSPLGLLLWYGLPIAAILGAGHVLASPRWIGLIWAGAFVTMGGKCLANASHCGRVHCYFTGPWFLLVAAASLLHGFAFQPDGPLSWSLIGSAAVVGSAVLWCGSEAILGRYRRSPPSS
ncbi:MAG: hypothetical protein PHP86_19310 [Nevskiales bacterium]|nr:hypothetical protein [Nevskiales bacterium]